MTNDLPTHLHLRAGTLEDVPALAELFNRYRMFYGIPDDRARCREFLVARLSRAEASVLLALGPDGRLAGFVLLYPTFSSISARPAWILNDLFVDAAHRRRGVATALLERVLANLSDGDAAWIALQTARGNAAAQALYRRVGFVEDTQFLTFTRNLCRA